MSIVFPGNSEDDALDHLPLRPYDLFPDQVLELLTESNNIEEILKSFRKLHHSFEKLLIDVDKDLFTTPEGVFDFILGVEIIIGFRKKFKQKRFPTYLPEARIVSSQIEHLIEPFIRLHSVMKECTSNNCIDKEHFLYPYFEESLMIVIKNKNGILGDVRKYIGLFEKMKKNRKSPVCSYLERVHKNIPGAQLGPNSQEVIDKIRELDLQASVGAMEVIFDNIESNGNKYAKNTVISYTLRGNLLDIKIENDKKVIEDETVSSGLGNKVLSRAVETTFGGKVVFFDNGNSYTTLLSGLKIG